MRACVVGLCTFALAGTLAAAPAAEARVLRATVERVTQVGAWKLGQNPQFGGAVRHFSEPIVLHKKSSTSCYARWRNGLVLDLALFSGGEPCSNQSRVQRIKVYGPGARRHGWRTWNGARVGTRVARLRRLHPAAVRRGRSWWIRTGRSFVGDCPASGCRVPRLKAVTKDGRVTGFVMLVGAAGD
jgi:hypothetical protein